MQVNLSFTVDEINSILSGLQARIVALGELQQRIQRDANSQLTPPPQSSENPNGQN